jgi:hypothetical protein
VRIRKDKYVDAGKTIERVVGNHHPLVFFGALRHGSQQGIKCQSSRQGGLSFSFPKSQNQALILLASM